MGHGKPTAQNIKRSQKAKRHKLEASKRFHASPSASPPPNHGMPGQIASSSMPLTWLPHHLSRSQLLLARGCLGDSPPSTVAPPLLPPFLQATPHLGASRQNPFDTQTLASPSPTRHVRRVRGGGGLPHRLYLALRPRPHPPPSPPRASSTTVLPPAIAGLPRTRRPRGPPVPACRGGRQALRAQRERERARIRRCRRPSVPRKQR